jgi:hypothetical protein
MDYPKSVPNVGLVNGKFIDENTVTGAVGSLIPSAWGNAVTDELLAVIKAAGLEPSESEGDQLLKAIRSSALFQTQPKFTSTKAGATTEFVQQALGSLAGYSAYTTNTVLKAADVGKYIYAGASNITLTLPDLASLPAGSKLYIQTGSGSNNVTIASVNGSIAGPNGNVSVTPNLVLSAGVATELISSGQTWIAVGGTGLVSLSVNGYEKLPSGLIRQWGTVVTTPSGAAVTFPIVFPNAVVSLIGSPSNNDLGGVFSIFTRSGLTNSGFTAWTKASSASKVQDIVQWVAIGF